MHTAHSDSKDDGHADLIQDAVLELRSKHNEHDIQSNDDGSSSNDD